MSFVKMLTNIRYQQCATSYKYQESTFYYHLKKQEDDEKQAEEAELEERIYKIFKESRNNYGTRKIKKELEKKDIIGF